MVFSGVLLPGANMKISLVVPPPGRISQQVPAATVPSAAMETAVGEAAVG